MNDMRHLSGLVLAEKQGERTPLATIDIPDGLRPFFWEIDFDGLSLDENFSYIVRRLLSVGGADAIAWLRGAVGDELIRDQIIVSKARGLTYTQVEPWIPRSLYDSWIVEDPNRAIGMTG